MLNVINLWARLIIFYFCFLIRSFTLENIQIETDYNKDILSESLSPQLIFSVRGLFGNASCEKLNNESSTLNLYSATNQANLLINSSLSFLCMMFISSENDGIHFITTSKNNQVLTTILKQIKLPYETIDIGTMFYHQSTLWLIFSNGKIIKHSKMNSEQSHEYDLKSKIQIIQPIEWESHTFILKYLTEDQIQIVQMSLIDNSFHSLASIDFKSKDENALIFQFSNSRNQKFFSVLSTQQLIQTLTIYAVGQSNMSISLYQTIQLRTESQYVNDKVIGIAFQHESIEQIVIFYSFGYQVYPFEVPQETQYPMQDSNQIIEYQASNPFNQVISIYPEYLLMQLIEQSGSDDSSNFIIKNLLKSLSNNFVSKNPHHKRQLQQTQAELQLAVNQNGVQSTNNGLYIIFTVILILLVLLIITLFGINIMQSRTRRSSNVNSPSLENINANIQQKQNNSNHLPKQYQVAVSSLKDGEGVSLKPVIDLNDINLSGGGMDQNHVMLIQDKQKLNQQNQQTLQQNEHNSQHQQHQTNQQLESSANQNPSVVYLSQVNEDFIKEYGATIQEWHEQMRNNVLNGVIEEVHNEDDGNQWNIEDSPVLHQRAHEESQQEQYEDNAEWK